MEVKTQHWITVRNDGNQHIVVEVDGVEVIRDFYVSGESEMNHSFNMTDILSTPDTIAVTKDDWQRIVGVLKFYAGRETVGILKRHKIAIAKEALSIAAKYGVNG